MEAFKSGSEAILGAIEYSPPQHCEKRKFSLSHKGGLSNREFRRDCPSYIVRPDRLHRAEPRRDEPPLDGLVLRAGGAHLRPPLQLEQPRHPRLVDVHVRSVERATLPPPQARRKRAHRLGELRLARLRTQDSGSYALETICNRALRVLMASPRALAVDDSSYRGS